MDWIPPDMDKRCPECWFLLPDHAADCPALPEPGPEDPDEFPDYGDPHPELAGTSLGEQPHSAAHCDQLGEPHLGPCIEPDGA